MGRAGMLSQAGGGAKLSGLAMAMHKLNRLPLHLTDDQGWRMEVRAFPRLTAHASWRAGTLLGHQPGRAGAAKRRARL